MHPRDDVSTQLQALLAASPGGLRAPELRARLPVRISQPTLSRRLRELRDRGLVTTEGRARATRYHAAAPGRLAELRSRALHEAVAHRLARDPELLDSVRERLARLRRVNPHGHPYHDRWAALLDGPLPRLLRVLGEDSEAADDLRRESPFTVLADPDMRRRVFKRFGNGTRQ